jgi:5-(carboxyamino)imidazole ribonucleotide mutase
MSVCVIMGSSSDKDISDKAVATLQELGVEYTVHVCSAHRTPERLKEIVEGSNASVFIGIAGLSAALPGAIAAITTRPVIGVPASGKVNLDCILSIVQMPPGVPVGAVGLDRGDNAALLAAQILALGDEGLASALKEHRAKMAERVASDDRSVKEKPL